MDLLKTLLLYMAMVYASSVQNLPDVEKVLQAVATPAPVVTATQTPTPVPTPTPTPVPTVQFSPNPAYKTVQVGDKGELVLTLQQKLAEYGYYEGEIDGRFGNQTRRAVERFQYNHGLVADGVAGRNTLSVLYDSNQVRFAASTPSPAPSAGALTVPPTSAPTFAPTPTPPVDSLGVPGAVAPSPSPAAARTTAAPTQTPSFAPMAGWTIQLDTKDEPLTFAGENAEESLLLLPYAYGDVLYVPIISILQFAGVVVVPSDSLEMTEYGFALLDDVYRITYAETQEGEPTDLNAYRNGQPQILPLRDVRLGGNFIYLPAQSVMSLTGIAFDLDAEMQVLTVSLPKPAEG